MASSARKHFDQDITRARAILEHARQLPGAEGGLRDDLLRSCWMFSVGAMDAYFCDVYVALLSGALRAKALQNSVALTDAIRRTPIPVGAILTSYQKRPNWRWRMAVRVMIERDNVLSLDEAKKRLNPFLRKGHKLFDDVILDWASRSNATSRFFGSPRTSFIGLLGKARETATKAAKKAMAKRIGGIIQRRHDCIHNCDRPKQALQPVGSLGTVRNIIIDVEFLIERCDAHVSGEYSKFLSHIGCSAATRNAVAY